MPSPFNNDNRGGATGAEDKKLNRSAVLTILAVVVALITIISAVVISNRSKEPTVTPTPSVTEKPSETQPLPEATQKPTEKPTTAPNASEEVGNKLPSFVLPVSGTLSSSHDPDMQVFSPTMNDYRVHLGIDLVTKEHATVYAAADGKISKIWSDPMMGYCMALSHSGNCVTIYKNLAETLPEGIKEGISVRAGQMIATVGESAIVEVGAEPHLHFEMTVGELAVDPLEYFDESALESIKVDSSHE